VNDVESKIRRSEEVENPKDLATCNRLLLDQQRLEDQLENRKAEVEQIKKEADENMQPRIDQISDRLDNLVEPLADRRERIQTAKEFHQLKRNLQDQVIWADERLPRAQSEDLGQSLHQVQKLLKRNQNLALEVDAAKPRVEALKEQVTKLSDKPETTDEQSEQIEKLETNLEEKWSTLKVNSLKHSFFHFFSQNIHYTI
jgi:spectrin beta